jgi:hypothetical protein
MRRSRRLLLVLAVVAVGAAATAVAAVSSSGGQNRPTASTCRLSQRGPIKHFVNIVFDNTHYARDRSNVASDLEQMPHLLSS